MRFAYDAYALLGVAAVAFIGGFTWSAGCWLWGRLARGL